MQSEFDVVIIGAGPAGSVAAARLVQDGLKVLILERSEFPRFVIGESLLPKCMDYLEKVEMIDCLEAMNFQIKSGVTFYHEDEICDFHFKERSVPGWEYTYQVKRADFDLALVNEVIKRDVDVRYKSSVRDISFSADQQVVSYENLQGEKLKVSAKFVMDASGYGRVLPRMLGLDKPIDSIPRGAVFAHIKDSNRTEKALNNIFVHSFNNNSAWIWSIPFSDGTASVGIVGDVDFINSCHEEDSKKFKQLVCEFPGLDGRFVDEEFLFKAKKLINYGASVEKMYGKGFVLCGNATEFIDPIFSSGVTLAIASGYEAADLVAKKLKGEEVDFEDYSKFMFQGVDVFKSYVKSWYNGDLHTIFFTKDGKEEFKRQICSVLAGYVWDQSNPFVKKHNSILPTLAKVIEMN
jgi:flavin-dependent dehydrogenase